jgi:sporulation protein YlmC with PRC-barrel domain
MTMADAVQFTIGAEASCSDGTCGEVARVIVDPITEELTHLVVEPEHRRGLGRLVPFRLIDATSGQVRLRCTKAEFEELDPAEETWFIPGTGGYASYGPGQVGYWPYYGLGMAADLGADGGISGGISGIGGGIVSPTVTSDTVPQGEVEVRRGDSVEATDGNIGRVQGLVIDRGSRHVTHVLLQEGHLWGRKEVAIPISSVASTSDGIRLRISKQEVQDLPPVDVDHPGASAGSGERGE